MITSWNLICEGCHKSFSITEPERERCPYCGKLAFESMVLNRKWEIADDCKQYEEKP